MGKFEENIPNMVDELDKKIEKLHWSKRDVDVYGHDCDCDFCDREGEGADPDGEEKIAKIDQEIAECELSRKRLIAHADAHGIKYATAKKVEKARS